MIINKGRQTGKTHDLITVSYYTGYPIVVKTMTMKETILEMAKSRGCDIDVFTLQEWKQSADASIYAHKPILVDELGMFLSDMIAEYFGTEVAAGTITMPMMSEQIFKEESK